MVTISSSVYERLLQLMSHLINPFTTLVAFSTLIIGIASLTSFYNPWILDYGASSHMISNKALFTSVVLNHYHQPVFSAYHNFPYSCCRRWNYLHWYPILFFMILSMYHYTCLYKTSNSFVLFFSSYCLLIALQVHNLLK